MEFWAKYQNVWKKIGIIGGVYLAMKYLVPLVIPFLIAALAAWWLRPLFLRLQKWFRIKPAFSASLFLVVLAAAVGLAVYFLGGQVVELCGDLFAGTDGTTAGGMVSGKLVSGGAVSGELASGGLASGEAVSNVMLSVERVLLDCCEAAERLLGLPAEQVQQVVLTQVHVWQEQMQGSWLKGAMGGSLTAIKGVGKVAAAVVITCISFVLLSGDFEKIKEEASGSAVWNRLVALGKGILEAIGGYVKAQCMIIGLIMVICVVGFFLAGSPYAVILGIGIGLMDALPVLGTGLFIVPWLVVEVIRGEYLTALILGLTYGACTLTREILEPRLVGKRLGLFPILVLMSVYVGVKVYGASGILLGPLSLLVIQELWREV